MHSFWHNKTPLSSIQKRIFLIFIDGCTKRGLVRLCLFTHGFWYFFFRREKASFQMWVEKKVTEFQKYGSTQTFEACNQLHQWTTMIIDPWCHIALKCNTVHTHSMLDCMKKKKLNNFCTGVLKSSLKGIKLFLIFIGESATKSSK